MGNAKTICHKTSLPYTQMATAIILLTDLLRSKVVKHGSCIHGDIGQVRRAAILASVDNNESLASQISYCVKDTAAYRQREMKKIDAGIRFAYTEK